MSYTKVLADIGISREKNISRFQHLAEELQPKEEDVNIIHKHLHKHSCLYSAIWPKGPFFLCFVSYHDFLMHDIHQPTFTE